MRKHCISPGLTWFSQSDATRGKVSDSDFTTLNGDENQTLFWSGKFKPNTETITKFLYEYDWLHSKRNLKVVCLPDWLLTVPKR